MPKTLGKFFIALLFSSSLIALPAAAGAAETNPAPGPRIVAEPPAGIPAQATPPAAASSGQQGAEPAKAERAFVIGFVDIARIGSESTQGKAAKARLKEKNDKLQAQITARKKQLEKQKTAIEAKLATLTPQQRPAKAKEFEKNIEEYQKFVQNAEKEFKGLQEELTRKLFQEIEEVVGDYGKANGYAAIIVKKEFLYLGSDVKSQDVTDDILKLVNEKGQKP